jgi:molybdopterin-guanine dinucleotide biosynthesis protein A
MMKGLTGVILAGGASRRMGRDKAFLALGERPLIAVVAERLRAVADEVIIVADNTSRYTPFADRCVPDVYSGVGPLGGIHAGLRAAVNELTLVVGCDMPFLDPDVLAWFVEAAEGADMVVLKQEEGLEPLHAVYRKSCLPVVEATILSGVRCAYSYLDQLKVRYVAPAEIARLDPDLCSFRNLNTPDQWRAALADGPTAWRESSLQPMKPARIPAQACCLVSPRTDIPSRQAAADSRASPLPQARGRYER